jgi:hypothetical protein
MAIGFHYPYNQSAPVRRQTAFRSTPQAIPKFTSAPSLGNVYEGLDLILEENHRLKDALGKQMDLQQVSTQAIYSKLTEFLDDIQVPEQIRLFARLNILLANNQVTFFRISNKEKKRSADKVILLYIVGVHYATGEPVFPGNNHRYPKDIPLPPVEKLQALEKPLTNPKLVQDHGTLYWMTASYLSSVKLAIAVTQIEHIYIKFKKAIQGRD